MTRYVADTHALFWYLVNSPRLGKAASRAFDEAAAGRARIFIPAIAIAELYGANRRMGSPLVLVDELTKLNAAGQFVLVPFRAEDVIDFERDAAVTEMHDRMIVGVARRLRAACLTRDENIVASRIVPTIW